LNVRATELLQIQRHRALGFPFRSFVVDAERGELAAHLGRFRQHGAAVGELTLRTFSGREIPVRLESVSDTAEPGLCWTALFDI